MKTTFSIEAYASMAIAYFSGLQVNGQVVYHDIDPDVILHEDNDEFQVDLDDDAIGEITFSKQSGTGVTYSSGNISFFGLFVDFPGAGNGIVGSLSASSFGTNYFPYVLGTGEMIGASDFFYHSTNILVFATDDIDGVADPLFDGNWHNFDGTPIVEKFVGFQWDYGFYKRYGWIRCSVIDSGKTLVIHDYALEMQLNYPITTGDTIGYVGINDQAYQGSFQVSFAGNNLLVSYPFSTQAELSVFDISGRLVHTDKLLSEETHIETTEWQSGVYLFVVRDGEKTSTTKCLIN